MRIALAALSALSLVACSKATDTNSAAAVDANNAAADAAATAPPATDASATPPQAIGSPEGNPAVKETHQENAGPAAKGANSFTEGQARGHIENSGYTNVTALTKDENGVWHGTAMKGGKTVAVSLDFKGNVVTN
jgi:putative membrane protein